MTSKSKAKGSAFEREVVEYLRSTWPAAERTRAGWSDDRGDIHGIVGTCWECKNQKSMNLAGWVDELVVEMGNAKADVGAVVHKRRGVTNPGEYYATLPLSVYVHLLREAGY